MRRYENYDDGYFGLREDPKGHWVLYSDHKAVEEVLDDVLESLKTLHPTAPIHVKMGISILIKRIEELDLGENPEL